VDATNLHRSQSAIKLTFSSTINGQSSSQQMTPPASAPDLCKSELQDPAADPAPEFPAPATAAAGDSIDNLEYLDEVDEVFEKLFNKMKEDERCGSGAEVPAAPPPPGRDVVGASGRYSAAPLYPGAAYGDAGCVGLMGPVGAAAAPTLLGDTGPAAETLKQMAAQHQSQYEHLPAPQYAAYPPPPDGYHPATAAFRGGAVRMPRYRAVVPGTAGGGGGGYVMAAGPSSMMGHVDPCPAGYGPVYPDTASYRAPVPSSTARFSGVQQQQQQCVTSSLQRLETQVRGRCFLYSLLDFVATSSQILIVRLLNQLMNSAECLSTLSQM